MLYSHENAIPKYLNADSRQPNFPVTRRCQISNQGLAVRDHSTLKVKLDALKDKLKRITGEDGRSYYHIEFEILATFHSADVEYQWRFQGSPTLLVQKPQLTLARRDLQ